MARTKASVGAKVSAGKSSKAVKASAPTTVVHSGTGGKSDRGSRSLGGGNPVCPRETPTWQKPITNFFVCRPRDTREQNGEDGATTSKPRSKRPIIESSDEESPEKPKNTVLDESITLEPLTGENSHKVDEYFPKNGEKGKGVGKKTKGKENQHSNSLKRGRDENENEEVITKKIKV